MPPVNRAPYLATSLSDFWSRRWNSIVNTVLRDHVYRRVAHRGALVALTATFVASAVLHAYLVGMLLGLGATMAWMAFFLAQAVFMWIERGLRVRRWRPPWGNAWTLGTLMVLYPLFIEPVLVLFDQV
jgi:D-alanyl-lipoteichoic acid acyltransferase DltB (MBOAT superfamily)